MAKTEIIATPGQPTVTITREFNAPADVVFRAHVDPELVTQWLGPRGMTMNLHLFDARHGGTWRYGHSDAEGNEYLFRGVFHGTPSVEHGIVQTFEFEGAPGHVSLESATFEEHNGKTTLRARSIFQSVEARDTMIEAGMEIGVTDSYERLDELLAQQAPVGAR